MIPDTRIFSLENRIEDLAKMNQAMGKIFKTWNISQDLSADLFLVMDEIISNIINHAYTDDQEHKILVHLSHGKDYIAIKIEDDGKEFNPLEQKAPILNVPIEERVAGGLGIYLVKNVMDSVEYKRVKNKNFLILKKEGK